MATANYLARDRAAIWHPFTQMLTADNPIVITKGEGCYLHAEDGSKYLDAISSWWVNLHGHAHPYIAKKIKTQADQLEHAIFAGFTHAPAIELAEKLISILPGQVSKTFYSDNGSTAVEIGLKMALQYWYNKDPFTKRKRIVCFKNSFHGETFGTMSAAGKNSLSKPFWSYLFEVDSIDPPYRGYEDRSVKQLQELLQKSDTACFIFEPLILGTAGMQIYPAEGLNALLKLCQDHDVITIADEVMTGFGRTGSLFASEQLQLSADIICLAKGLTGGFLPLGATACKEFIFEAFLSQDASKALLHGHSYTANPLACSSALASLDLLLTETCSIQRDLIHKSHAAFCQKWKQHPKLKRCEALGTILVVEYASNQETNYFHAIRDRLYRFFLSHKILIRPLGNVLYLIPPYCITLEELQYIYEHILTSLEEVIP